MNDYPLNNTNTGALITIPAHLADCPTRSEAYRRLMTIPVYDYSEADRAALLELTGATLPRLAPATTFGLPWNRVA